ncbi:hypothetical protein FIU87_02635 [Bacillus sp. THAF10]|uniref:hypothetical protein n=1 Tax=Bacillus sp. THAF10 TaxID=2587848 RepID=UPI0012AA652B|nr:hypothetical protein [Bacillus sp. THAF10]QFT87537.1 hypothetical protein FIU87_02635 [Bacillus sp. THAF10]
MPRNILILPISILCIVILTSCAENTKESNGPFSHYQDEKMIGTVWEIADNELVVDISEWEKRDIEGDGLNDDGYMYNAKLNKNTKIHFENDNQATLADIKVGQKIQVNPPRNNKFEGYPNEIILLDMSFKEKYATLLSHNEVPRIVIMYNEHSPITMDLEAIMNNTATNIDGTQITYQQEYVVDFKEELEIERFPVIFVFNQEELLFKTYEEEELYEFLESLGSE